MAGNDTLTTATQNLVVAFNSINKSLQYANGQFTTDTYPDAGLSTVRVYHGRCRLVAVTIIATGGTVNVYDSSEPTIIPASSLKYTLDNTATLGIYPVGAEFTNGMILVVTGSTHANVTYSVY